MDKASQVREEECGLRSLTFPESSASLLFIVQFGTRQSQVSLISSTAFGSGVSVSSLSLPFLSFPSADYSILAFDFYSAETSPPTSHPRPTPSTPRPGASPRHRTPPPHATRPSSSSLSSLCSISHSVEIGQASRPCTPRRAARQTRLRPASK